MLETNWTGDHMVPSRRLYPHQWSWDAAFIAIGLAYVNPTRAWRDLRSLFEAQWPDGRVPHIVFDPATAEDDYFPGPAFWDVPAYGNRAGPRQHRHRAAAACTRSPPGRSTGTRRRTARPARSEARTELEWLYPRLVAQQDYLTGPRDLGGDGLASIVHPWESGPGQQPGLGRGDGQRAGRPGAAHHATGGGTWTTRTPRTGPPTPTTPGTSGWCSATAPGATRTAACWTGTRFAVECPSFNAILGAAELALAQIAGVLGQAAEAVAHRERAQRITAAIAERLWNPDSGTFHARDVRTGKLSPARCVSGLMPLMLPDLPAEQVEAIMTRGTVGRGSACPGRPACRCPATTGPRPTSTRCGTGAARSGST